MKFKVSSTSLMTQIIKETGTWFTQFPNLHHKTSDLQLYTKLYGIIFSSHSAKYPCQNFCVIHQDECKESLHYNFIFNSFKKIAPFFFSHITNYMQEIRRSHLLQFVVRQDFLGRVLNNRFWTDLSCLGFLA